MNRRQATSFQGAPVILPGDLDRLVFSTFMGGSGGDDFRACVLGPDGSFVIAGSTTSRDWPVHQALQPAFAGGGKDVLVVKFSPSGNPGERAFLRGDSNGNGRLSLSDAILILLLVFRGEIPGTCEKAADRDDDGAIALVDALALLLFLLAGRRAPEPPFPEPGLDPRPDDLDCA